MEYHQIDPFYTSLMTQKCMKDYSTVDLILDNQKTIFNPKRYSYEPPRQIDHIHVQAVTHGIDIGLRPPRGKFVFDTIKIPSWLYLKHEIIPDLMRHLGFCYRSNRDCHGTLDDHVNILLKTIWGPSTIVPGTKQHQTFDEIRKLLTIYIQGAGGFDNTGVEMKLMKMVLKHDMVVRHERKKWREENKDAVMWSICEDGGTSYVSDQAAKLLNPDKKGESRKRDADETLRKLGWEKKDRRWETVFGKDHQPLQFQILKLMVAEHELDKAKQKGNREGGYLQREAKKQKEKEKEKENVEVPREVRTVFHVRRLIEAPKAGEEENTVEEDNKGRKEKGKSVTRRIGVGILRFMKIRK
ncbi:hypothetical protein TWF506_008049 [Arthrobotrys conoides]|uniref:Uncharacterized protein n=1 Tax=Arthrobotrys conoides TaxID=74498 RepID=A0AAN8N5A7_9PEZI